MGSLMNQNCFIKCVHPGHALRPESLKRSGDPHRLAAGLAGTTTNLDKWSRSSDFGCACRFRDLGLLGLTAAWERLHVSTCEGCFGMFLIVVDAIVILMAILIFDF